MNRRFLHVVLRAACACVVLCCAARLAAAQTAADKLPPGAPQNTPTEQAATTRTNADESFELNITERRITRDDYEASTSVEAGDGEARGLALRIGVMVRAGHIDLLLRGVQGNVRFRASLEPVLRRLGTRRSSNEPPSQTSAPAP